MVRVNYSSAALAAQLTSVLAWQCNVRAGLGHGAGLRIILGVDGLEWDSRWRIADHVNIGLVIARPLRAIGKVIEPIHLHEGIELIDIFSGEARIHLFGIGVHQLELVQVIHRDRCRQRCAEYTATVL